MRRVQALSDNLAQEIAKGTVDSFLKENQREEEGIGCCHLVQLAEVDCGGEQHPRGWALQYHQLGEDDRSEKKAGGVRVAEGTTRGELGEKN